MMHDFIPHPLIVEPEAPCPTTPSILKLSQFNPKVIQASCPMTRLRPGSDFTFLDVSLASLEPSDLVA